MRTMLQKTGGLRDRIEPQNQGDKMMPVLSRSLLDGDFPPVFELVFIEPA